MRMVVSRECLCGDERVRTVAGGQLMEPPTPLPPKKERHRPSAWSHPGGSSCAAAAPGSRRRPPGDPRRSGPAARGGKGRVRTCGDATVPAKALPQLLGGTCLVKSSAPPDLPACSFLRRTPRYRMSWGTRGGIQQPAGHRAGHGWHRGDGTPAATAAQVPARGSVPGAGGAPQTPPQVLTVVGRQQGHGGGFAGLPALALPAAAGHERRLHLYGDRGREARAAPVPPSPVTPPVPGPLSPARSRPPAPARAPPSRQPARGRPRPWGGRS